MPTKALCQTSDQKKESSFRCGISLSNEFNATAYTAIGLIGEKNTWKWLDGTALNFTNMYYWDDQIGTPKDGFCAYMRTQAQDIYLSTWFKHEVNFRGFKQAVCKMNANL
uniref:C-type lectin domain-containing protein n=1 Tax=Panagrolaimus davidi TaxID=227884 RepID=A0A914Q0H5_9BILA